LVSGKERRKLTTVKRRGSSKEGGRLKGLNKIAVEGETKKKEGGDAGEEANRRYSTVDPYYSEKGSSTNGKPASEKMGVKSKGGSEEQQGGGWKACTYSFISETQRLKGSLEDSEGKTQRRPNRRGPSVRP